MNIALFSDTYLPDINGVATSTYILRNALVRHGHRVIVVTTELPEGSHYVDHEDIIRIPGIELKKLYGYRASGFYSFKGMKELREIGLDVIHVQQEFGIGIFGRIVGKALNLPIVYTYHTMYEDYTHYVNIANLEMADNFMKGLVSKISRAYGNNATELIVPSEKTKEVLERYGIEKEIHVIATGLELAAFDPANMDKEKVSKIKDMYHLNGFFTLIFLGRIAKEKSVDFIIRAISLVVEKRKDIRLLIVGGGPSLEEYKDLVHTLNLEEYVIFTGPQPSQEVPHFYHAADCFVSASITETQGLTYIEAMASELPVIARYDKNLEDTIIDQYNGYFIENEEQLAQKVLQMMEMDLHELAKHALESTKPFSSEVFYEKVIKVYEQAIMHHQFCYHVTSIKNGLNDTSIVSFKSSDDAVVVELPHSKIEEYGLKKGVILQPDQLNEIRDYEGVVQSYHRALKYLAIRDYTEKEMKNKLIKLELYSLNQIEKTISLLKERGLINDLDYASQYLERAARSGEGVHKATLKLKRRGISDEVIDQCQELYSDELAYEAAYSLCEKMYLTNTTRPTAAIMNKIRDKLYRQGFSQDIIQRVFNNFVFNENTQLNQRLLENEYTKIVHKYDSNKDSKTRQKVYAHLVRKGFSADKVIEILNERWNKHDD